MASSFFKMLILGAPGSGKGTISNRIVRDFALKHLAVGDILRSQVEKKTELGKRVESYLSSGSLVPDEVVVDTILDVLAQYRSTPWLLDGFARTLSQAKSLDKSEQLNLVLSLEVPNEVIIDRLKDRWIHVPSGRIYNLLFNPPKEPGIDDVTKEALIQREDDKPESILKRLKTYESNTKPIKDFYKSRNLLVEFHGTESNEIYPRINKYMKENYGI